MSVSKEQANAFADPFDDDGYPTDEALDALDAFSGTAAEYLDAIEALWSSYGVIRRSYEPEYRPGLSRCTVELITGGWSGNESVISVVQRSLFHLAFWQASNRGGLHVYAMNADQTKFQTMGNPLRGGKN